MATFRTGVAAVALCLPSLLGCGSSEPPPPEQHVWTPQRPEFEAIARRLIDGANEYLGLGRITTLQEQLQAPDLDVRERLIFHILLTQELLKAGRVDEAVETMERAFTLLEPDMRPEVRAGLAEMRGVAYLRKAEVENCVRRHSPESCIFPLAGQGVHQKKEAAGKAREDFLFMLEVDPENLTALWLLNVTHMALGTYPQEVPERFRIPPSAFASEHDLGRFPDIAPALGVDTFNQCGGAILEDFDNDGLLDIVTSTFDPEGPLTYYRSTGDGSFEDRSAVSRLDDQLGGLNVLASDYDNDGHRDLLVLRGAWLHADGQIRNSLLHNNGDGTFTDVTRALGLADPARPTQAAVWADFDNDGRLDLYVANESAREFGAPERDFPSQLFRANPDGTFTDIATRAGVTNDRYGKSVTAGDYDNDGDMDLYVSNVGRNRLYRNDGDGLFTDVADLAGVTEPVGRSFAAWFFDVDNDGWLDLFVAGYQSTVGDLAAEALGLPNPGLKPRLYRNRGDGTFEDITRAAGLHRNYLPMGANFGDLDNDGFLDIYLGTGDPDYRSLMPNIMLRNDGGRRFQDVTQSGGFGHLQKGHGVAFGDVDNDGDQDIYHQLGGFFRGDRFHNALFHNPGHGHRHLHLKLVGRQTNRDAVGARIEVVIEDAAGRRRSFHRAVGSVSSFGGSPIQQEIGLGDARRIVRVEVRWPASGERTVLEDVPLDGYYRVTEGTERYETVNRSRIELKAARP